MLKESTEATFEENKDHSTEKLLKDDDSLFEMISCNICKKKFLRDKTTLGGICIKKEPNGNQLIVKVCSRKPPKNSKVISCAKLATKHSSQSTTWAVIKSHSTNLLNKYETLFENLLNKYETLFLCGNKEALRLQH